MTHEDRMTLKITYKVNHEEKIKLQKNKRTNTSITARSTTFYFASKCHRHRLPSPFQFSLVNEHIRGRETLQQSIKLIR